MCSGYPRTHSFRSMDWAAGIIRSFEGLSIQTQKSRPRTQGDSMTTTLIPSPQAPYKLKLCRSIRKSCWSTELHCLTTMHFHFAWHSFGSENKAVLESSWVPQVLPMLVTLFLRTAQPACLLFFLTSHTPCRNSQLWLTTNSCPQPLTSQIQSIPWLGHLRIEQWPEKKGRGPGL